MHRSVLAKEIHSSYWPTILRTDSSASSGVYKAVTVISWLGTAAKILTAIAAVVTPLGLYQTIVPQSPTTSTFHYVEDTSAFGDGTPPRDENTRFSRVCGGWGPVVCPNSPGNISWLTNATSTYVSGDWYDTRIPQHVKDTFQSGLATMGPSVSSLFDIQSRYIVLSQTTQPGQSVPVDNGTAYPVCQLRPIQSLILDHDYRLVEGLIVDLQNGGIGFRNHTAPAWRPQGSEWSEDLLFIEPETQCVNLNLTLDYDTAISYGYGDGGYENLVLTDRGGFVDLPQDFSPINWTTIYSQSDPQLIQRAFTGAWVNNFVSMNFLNATNPGNYKESGLKAFSYLNSHLGKTFPLMRQGTTTQNFQFDASLGLQVSISYGDYLEGTDIAYTGVNAGNSGLNDSSISELGNLTHSQPALYPNPFHIERQNFTPAGRLLTLPNTPDSVDWQNLTFSIATLCSRTTDLDYANISNIAVGCGLVYGVPQRQDPGNSMNFEDPGSTWSIPLYSCATGVKSIIKTVSFQFNGSDDLSGLKIQKIRPKPYANQSSMPLWGVENTSIMLRDVRPLWGLVAPESASQMKLSTLRKEGLWLPGTANDILNTMPSFQNLPGVQFYTSALAGTYDILGGVGGFIDYSGASSYSLLRQWQRLSSTAGGTAQILNLVWTDIAANYVLGTRSATTSAASDTKAPDFPVVFYKARVAFKLAYGIPAFLTLLVTALVCVFAASSMLLRGSGPRRMTTFLNWTSTGRIFTSNLPDGDAKTIYIPLKHSGKWVEEEGRQEITVTGQEREEETIEPKTEEEENVPPATQQLLQHVESP